MPGPKGVFKSVGKKLKKVFSKKKNRNRRERRHAGLPQQPGGQAPRAPVPVPQQDTQNQERGPRGWLGGQHQGERGGTQIGQNRGLKTTENTVQTPTVVETNDAPNPYTTAPNPYAQSPYSTVMFDPDDTGSVSDSGSEGHSNKSESQVSETPQSTNTKTEKESPYVRSGPLPTQKGPYVNSGSTPVPDNGSSSSVSSSVETSTNTKNAEKEKKDREKKQKVDDKVNDRIGDLKREKKAQLSKAKNNVVSGGGYEDNVVSGGYQDNNVVSGGYQDNNVVSGGYEDNVVSGGYENDKSPYETTQNTPMPPVSESSLKTDDIELTQEELDIIRAQVEREVGYGAPDIQKLFTGEGLEEPTSTLMRSLRGNSKHTVDTPEIAHGQSIEVKRTQLSPNEQESKGWALAALRDTYIKQDAYKGQNGSFNTKYFFDETTKLEGSVRALGSQQENGREKHVIHYKDGKWIDADKNTVDTSQALEMNYAITMRKQALQDKLERVQRSTRTEQDQKTLDALVARIIKLNEKLKWENLRQHKSVTGKYIYVMNSAGELFAGKAMQFVIHHSSFLAGGAVASAGEVGISGGTLDYISNQSGHYRPGPAYLWQAVKQLELNGCPLDAVTVHVMGVRSKFKNAKDFLGAMDPAADPKLFDVEYAINHLNGIVAGLKAKKDVA